MSILVEDAGLLTTVQDLGRTGYRHYGVTTSGAMDQQAASLANIIVGNAPSQGVLECTLMGPTLYFTHSTWVCLMGADMQGVCEGNPVARGKAFYVGEGQRLSLGSARQGCRGYIAIQSGLKAPLVMGSVSTFLLGQCGGFEGRALRQGDRLLTNSERVAHCVSKDWWVSPALTDYMSNVGTVRYLPDEPINDSHAQQFERQVFSVSHQSDRMGYRLTGAVLAPLSGGERLSEGVCTGTIQLPADGEPIILMNDCQTTGGYPVLGQVISVDLAKIAQLKPGDTVSFAPVTIEEAQCALKKEQQDRARLAIAARHHWSQEYG